MNEKTTGFELMEPASPEVLIPDYGLWPWALGAALLAAITIITIVIICRRNKTQSIDSKTIRNAAFQEAMTDLSALSSLDPRNVAVQASLILRKYLSLVANDPALYETQEEFIARSDSLKSLTAETRAAAEAGLNRLACLKYAADIPSTAPDEIIADSKSLLETLHRGGMP